MGGTSEQVEKNQLSQNKCVACGCGLEQFLNHMFTLIL